MHILLADLLIWAASGVFSLLACGWLGRLARQRGWVARGHDERAGPGGVPILGGPGVLIAVLCGCLLALALGALPRLTAGAWGGWAAIVLGFALVGAVDDARRLSPQVRLVAEVTLALGLTIGSRLCLRGPHAWLPPPNPIWPVSLLVALLMVAGANAFNLSDNADGLAAGTGLLSFLAAGACCRAGAPSQGEPMLHVALAASGALAGFLFWNRPPARLYLGDSGTLALGALLAWTLWPLGGQGQGPADVLATGLVAGYLLFDPLYAVIGRLARGTPPWRGGTDHPSHHLLRLGGRWPRAWALILTVHAFSAATGLGVLARLLPPETLAVALLPWAALLLACARGARR